MGGVDGRTHNLALNEEVQEEAGVSLVWKTLSERSNVQWNLMEFVRYLGEARAHVCSHRKIELSSESCSKVAETTVSTD